MSRLNGQLTQSSRLFLEKYAEHHEAKRESSYLTFHYLVQGTEIKIGFKEQDIFFPKFTTTLGEFNINHESIFKTEMSYQNVAVNNKLPLGVIES